MPQTVGLHWLDLGVRGRLRQEGQGRGQSSGGFPTPDDTGLLGLP